jgi:phosphate transport system ATP-binding protein
MSDRRQAQSSDDRHPIRARRQAARVADFTAFLTSEPDGDGALVGRLVEFGTTEKIFSRPADERTEAYVRGRFG